MAQVQLHQHTEALSALWFFQHLFHAVFSSCYFIKRHGVCVCILYFKCRNTMQSVAWVIQYIWVDCWSPVAVSSEKALRHKSPLV